MTKFEKIAFFVFKIYINKYKLHYSLKRPYKHYIMYDLIIYIIHLGSLNMSTKFNRLQEFFLEKNMYGYGAV